ncbi:hypothetical protein HPB50_006498 [Hyalomma asiaticum]|uniref:Uncharacterized protein n=1 Tax=Hyalomma asiaticum TaxID=266040 RepID=A0ACB7TCU2_HYAAI|nr:hypothetical protein HPB50_006498 [Hyalomma asiaticum]
MSLEKEQGSPSALLGGPPLPEEQNTAARVPFHRAPSEIHASFQEWFNQFHCKTPISPKSFSPEGRILEKLGRVRKIWSCTMVLQPRQDLVPTAGDEDNEVVTNGSIERHAPLLVELLEYCRATQGSMANAESRFDYLVDGACPW